MGETYATIEYYLPPRMVSLEISITTFIDVVYNDTFFKLPLHWYD